MTSTTTTTITVSQLIDYLVKENFIQNSTSISGSGFILNDIKIITQYANAKNDYLDFNGTVFRLRGVTIDFFGSLTNKTTLDQGYFNWSLKISTENHIYVCQYCNTTIHYYTLA